MRATPVGREQAVADVAVESGKRPVAHVWGAAVFDGIIVDVVGAALQIGFVADGVFVEPPLPNAALAAPLFAGGEIGGSREVDGKVAFDEPPAQGVIAVVGRQRPNGVHMVGHYAGCDGFKKVLFLHGNIGSTQ